jgi:hypothetical protein
MLKKFLVIIPLFSLLTSPTHAVHIVDALNHFLHSTAPKVDRDYPYTQAKTPQDIEVIYKLRCKKITEHAVVVAFLTACVFNYVTYKSRNPRPNP